MRVFLLQYACMGFVGGHQWHAVNKIKFTHSDIAHAKPNPS
jgi:hypothetical protein